MTNVYGSPEKLPMKTWLFKTAIRALENEGWTVDKEKGSGKSSVRRISNKKMSMLVSIRTSQDSWIAFPRLDDDSGWRTLSEVDAVVAVSVDNKLEPRFAKVHLIDGEEMRDRFDRAYSARKNAGYTIPIGRGVWVSLYETEANEPVTLVGAGAGLKFPPILVVPIKDSDRIEAIENESTIPPVDEPLTISEAKRRLAVTFGVSEANIKITVEA